MEEQARIVNARQEQLLASLDWVAVGHFGAKPASRYVNAEGESTEIGKKSKGVSSFMKGAHKVATYGLGMIKTVLEMEKELNPEDYVSDENRTRRAAGAPFVGLSLDAIPGLVEQARNALPEAQQTPPPTPTGRQE